MVKQIAAIPWIGETTVALEQLGYTEEQITRMLSDKRRAQALARIEARAAGDAYKG
jgi:Holliday junction resolvasome RuvABC DNA-binding subunit